MRNKLVNFLVKGVLPFLFAIAILWWMYREFRWDDFKVALSENMAWDWMLWSIPFGILAQLFRALRWRDMCTSIGENARLSSCSYAVFLSYASSLAIPRIGEVLRCGILHRRDGVSFSGSLGTVMSERVVDILLVLLISTFTFFSQIPTFMHFCTQTGVTLDEMIHSFSSMGYMVTAISLIVALVVGILILRKICLFSKTRTMLHELWAGLLSVFHLEHPLRFLFYSIAIWISYFLHFYLTFFCFDFTRDLGAVVALVAFVVGTFAVLVPTPNGAGPWHFSVKTILVLFGVSATDGALYVLIVHTIQTLLVVLLGLYAMVAIGWGSASKG